MKLVILDRDGVINDESNAHIKAPDEWHPISGSVDAIARLNHSGFRVVVATEQPGLAEGSLTIGDLNSVHHAMFDELAKVGGHLDGIFFCPHGPGDDCACRKPSPGLLYEISRRFRIQLHQVPVISKSSRVIDAARAVNARPILIGSSSDANISAAIGSATHVAVYPDLAAAVDALVKPQSP